MKDSNAKSKVIILLTDGENNSGYIDPYTAAQLASAIGVRIYTIGIGKQGMVPVPGPIKPFRQYIQSQFDEGLLKRIAATCDGKYFSATDSEALENERYRPYQN